MHLSWPGNSPDLKPNKSIWELESKRSEKKLPCKILWKRLGLRFWHNSPELTETIKKSIASMPQHINAVNANKGGFKNYYCLKYIVIINNKYSKYNFFVYFLSNNIL